MESMSGQPGASATNAKKTAMRTVRDVVLTLVVLALLCGAVLGLFHWATQTNWLLTAVFTVFYAFAVCVGIWDLRSNTARQYPVYKGFAVIFLTAFSAIAVAGAVSFLLLQAGAAYVPAPPAKYEYATLVGYYMWVLLDMLPGVKANELLGFDASVTPQNVRAGIPVILFRAFVLFGLLAALKVWWQGRKNNAQSSPKADQSQH